MEMKMKLLIETEVFYGPGQEEGSRDRGFANPGKSGVDNGVLSCDLIRIIDSQPKLVGRESGCPPLAGRLSHYSYSFR